MTVQNYNITIWMFCIGLIQARHGRGESLKYNMLPRVSNRKHLAFVCDPKPWLLRWALYEIRALTGHTHKSTITQSITSVNPQSYSAAAGQRRWPGGGWAAAPPALPAAPGSWSASVASSASSPPAPFGFYRFSRPESGSTRPAGRGGCM